MTYHCVEEISFECDGTYCSSTVLRTGTKKLEEAIVKMRQENWTSKVRLELGSWEHLCPRCTKLRETLK